MLLAALMLTACGSSGENGDNPIKSAGVLRVGTEGVYSPFSYHDASGQLVGYDVDVARAVGDKIGVERAFSQITESLGWPASDLDQLLARFDPAQLPRQPWIYRPD